MSGIDEVQVDREIRFDTIEEAVADLKAGKMIVVLDAEDRENEGDVVCAAELITPAHVNFIIREARGLLCVPMSEDRLARLGLDSMVRQNTAPMGTSFTVSVDAVRGTTTGISAQDRAVTIRALADLHTRPEDLARPGHVFPLRAAQGGVLRRAGHTEGVVDLMNLAGLQPVGALCEILDEDGTMARPPYLFRFARKHHLKVISIAQLIDHRFQNDRLVRRMTTTKLPTRYGDFELHLYKSSVDDREHLALVKGDPSSQGPALVRLHSSCLTGDILGSLRCDCGEQVTEALARIEAEGAGVFLYMMQEGRGIGLANKILTYALQDEGLDTVEANVHLGFKPDERHYGVAAQILADLGVTEVRLLTNNPAKHLGLETFGIRITERVPLEVGTNPANLRYLATKRDKMGHLLDLGGAPARPASRPIPKGVTDMNEYKGSLDGSGKRFAIVASRFNESFVTHVVDGAVDCLQRLGAEEDDVDLFWVPGSFEVPQGTRAAAMSGNYDAVIALGVIIRGATPHFDLIAAEVTRAIGAVGRDTGVPTIFGIVTADTMEQAAERCGSKMGNRGWNAAEAAVEMANLGEAFSGWRGPGEAEAVVHEHEHEHEPAAPAPAKRRAKKAAKKGGKGDRNRRRAGA